MLDHVDNLLNCMRRAGYVFIDVGLFVSTIAEKLLNRFPQNFHGKVAHGPRKKALDFDDNQEYVMLG